MVAVQFARSRSRARVGIDLRGGDVGVAQQQLYHAQVGAMVQQVGGEGMAQRVRRQRRMDAGLARMALDQVPEGLACHALAALRDEQRVAGARPAAPAGLRPGSGAASRRPAGRRAPGVPCRPCRPPRAPRPRSGRSPPCASASARTRAGRWRTSAPAWCGRAGRAARRCRVRPAAPRPEASLSVLGSAAAAWPGAAAGRIGRDQVFAQGPAEEALEHRQPPVGRRCQRVVVARGEIGPSAVSSTPVSSPPPLWRSSQRASRVRSRR